LVNAAKLNPERFCCLAHSGGCRLLLGCPRPACGGLGLASEFIGLHEFLISLTNPTAMPHKVTRPVNPLFFACRFARLRPCFPGFPSLFIARFARPRKCIF